MLPYEPWRRKAGEELGLACSRLASEALSAERVVPAERRLLRARHGARRGSTSRDSQRFLRRTFGGVGFLE